ncbi:5-methylcytosine-specific restriction enzyme B [Curvibacter sp. AEP1-3]|uniref:AAA family ATPase n=1 Tax=Curvibacter sp. AEP1-3 TaxID=1844971 RepID=UPI000B56811C|nr:AAA family ATPase [Curvibacter sp. AEP1-3]ARV17031.1 5-methylcytosine-specific restriction enzyme B [Curvibacter sp. AEP1-3]
MSRYCGDVNTFPILEAATQWRDRALVEDGSVFTDRNLWTSAGLESLEQFFINSPDEGSGNYVDKLQAQLAQTTSEVKQLASEMQWLLLLAASNTLAPRKRQITARVWEWSGEALPESASPLLTNEVLRGIGNGGPGYNNHRWRELVFCINTLLNFKRLPVLERQELVADSWKFARWLETVPDSSARQFRHMILYLLFPDDFERIWGKGDRRAVAIAFSGLSAQSVNGLSPFELDETLRKVRFELEKKYGTNELDYYLPPLKGLWKPQDFKATTEGITASHVFQAIAEVDESGIPPDAHSTTYDLLHAGKRYPPKLILSFAARYANGSEFDRKDFSGGEASPAFKLLKALGFEIVPKEGLRDLLNKFLKQAEAMSSLAVSSYAADYRGLKVKVSFGQGVQARVPWVAFLGPGQQVSKGSYPVLLYYREAKELIVAYGISETHSTESLWKDLAGRDTIKDFLTKKLGRPPERYGDSFVAKTFPISEVMDLDKIAQAIDSVIGQYKPMLNLAAEPTQDEVELISEELYTIDDALEGLFIERGDFALILKRLEVKQNLILQGPPGVGKTHFARRVAHALAGSRNRTFVGIVQFHQTYSYEDFVQGFRPSGTGFNLKNGLFYEFCKTAEADPEQNYVFVIDEINRGNLSKVFGELMMLIESDKRGLDFAIPLTYSASSDETFFVPKNVYLLGLMNTADRSLSMVDYALRRRFSFLTLKPGFDSPKFAEFLREHKANEELINRLIGDMSALNSEIEGDTSNLGPGFAIGHSYFCAGLSGEGATKAWYLEIIETEVLPLLHEYWFDDKQRVDTWEKRLLRD